MLFKDQNLVFLRIWIWLSSDLDLVWFFFGSGPDNYRDGSSLDSDWFLLRMLDLKFSIEIKVQFVFQGRIRFSRFAKKKLIDIGLFVLVFLVWI